MSTIQTPRGCTLSRGYRTHSEVLLCEREVDMIIIVLLAHLLENTRDRRRSAKVRANGRLHATGTGTREVLARLNAHTEAAVDVLEVGATEERAGAEERKRVVRGTSVVDSDIPHHVLVDLLRQVDVDAQEVGVRLRRLDLLQQALEPAEGWRVTADPEELYAAEVAQVPTALAVPDVLENRGKGSDTDTGTNEYCDLGVENVLRRRTVGTIDADHRHRAVRRGRVELDEVTTGGCCRRECLLGSLEIGVLLVILDFALHGSPGKRSDNGRAGANTLAEGLCPVTDLTNVHRDVRVLGRRRDGELRDLLATA